MKCVIDVEANALHNPTKVWCIVAKDIDKEDYYVFSEQESSERSNTTRKSLSEFDALLRDCSVVIGHNILGWDIPILRALGYARDLDDEKVIDTLILSKMIDYPRGGHSIEDYGIQFGIPKGRADFTHWSSELEDYCIRDVDICHRIYLLYSRYCSLTRHRESIRTEHRFQSVINALEYNGFGFNTLGATALLAKVQLKLNELDKEIKDVFQPKLRFVKEIHPRINRHGTLNRSDFRWFHGEDLSEFNGGPFCRAEWVEFNPNSHRQIVTVLNEAGWSPSDKTRAHIDAIRNGTVDDSTLKYGWKVNETNLLTLPERAPKPARTLAQRILLESRRRTLTEWLGLVDEDNRIRGKFYGLGAWTHRMAHQAPNTANIPTGTKMFGREMRSLWRAPEDRLLVGVDADGIQLRIFAHYINDEEFTDAIVHGSKSDKSDPHSLNQRILGDVCRTRDIAKRWIYAFLLGAGQSKLREILGSSEAEARNAYDRLVSRYKGLERLKSSIIPADSRRGWFYGLDGRRVRIPGESPSERRHLAMSGYLQNGEAVIMKSACNLWHPRLKDYDAMLVNFVHDEWQVECPNNMTIAEELAKIMAESLTAVGIELGLKCPLTGSYWSDTHNDYSIGVNWSQTH